MKSVFICLFLFCCMHLLYGQKGCYIRLTDKFFFDTIVPDGSWILENCDYVSDTTTSLIYLKKNRDKKLTITGAGYEPLEVKRKWRKLKNDTLTLRLIPNPVTVDNHLHAMWITNSNQDTLFFANESELHQSFQHYFACLMNIQKTCDGGMCNYSNTYIYHVSAEYNGTVWKIKRVLRTTSSSCDELYQYLNRFPEVFPCFQLKEAALSDSMSVRITFCPY